jgi:hypothetical protein
MFAPGKSPVKVQPDVLDIPFLEYLYVVYMEWEGGGVSLQVVNVTRTNLDQLASILHFLNHFWIASRLVCSFCEAMAGSLSVASTAVSSAKVAVVDSGVDNRSAV